MQIKKIIFFVALICAFVGFAAPAFKSSFARQPPEAAKALGGTYGKPIDAGYVFVDGKYLAPPYKVDRVGTVIKINGVQVTGQVIAWNEFIKTQSGVTVSKTETPAAGGDDLFDDAPASEPEVEEDDDDDDSSALDDLFDDDPKPKKKAAKKPAKKRAAPRPKKPTVTVSYSLEGDFVPNEKSRELVKKIAARRKAIESKLLNDGLICFGSRYTSIQCDKLAAKRILEKLPEIQKQHKDPAQFTQAVRAAGLVYLSEPCINDLCRNRTDYYQLMERRKKDAEKSKWSNILGM